MRSDLSQYFTRMHTNIKIKVQFLHIMYANLKIVLKLEPLRLNSFVIFLTEHVHFLS